MLRLVTLMHLPLPSSPWDTDPVAPIEN